MNSDLFILKRNKVKQILWTEEQIQFIVDSYSSGMYATEIAKKFYTHYHNITKVLKDQGIEIKNFRNKYPVNEDYFEDINTSEKAYWLGLFYADGTVNQQNASCRLGLKDEEHIEKFKKAIGAINHKIGKTVDKRWKKVSTVYFLSVKSKKMFADLCKWGCVPDKTHENLHLPNIREELIPHFVRGYFDGDGSLHKVISGWRIQIIGSETLINEIKALFNSNVKTVKEYTLDENGNKIEKQAYYFQIMGNVQLFRILNWMYQGSTEEMRLNRKYDCYLTFCSETGASLSNL